MQDKLKLEILKEGYLVQKQTVEESLAAKARFVKAQFEKDLTEQVFKRVKIEEDHIRQCLGLLQTLEDLVEGFENELQAERTRLQKSKELNTMYVNDLTDYRNKYFNIVLQLNESTRDFGQHGATGQKA
jgi:hypothetical protein